MRRFFGYWSLVAGVSVSGLGVHAVTPTEILEARFFRIAAVKGADQGQSKAFYLSEADPQLKEEDQNLVAIVELLDEKTGKTQEVGKAQLNHSGDLILTTTGPGGEPPKSKLRVTPAGDVLDTRDEGRKLGITLLSNKSQLRLVPSSEELSAGQVLDSRPSKNYLLFGFSRFSADNMELGDEDDLDLSFDEAPVFVRLSRPILVPGGHDTEINAFAIEFFPQMSVTLGNIEKTGGKMIWRVDQSVATYRLSQNMRSGSGPVFVVNDFKIPRRSILGFSWSRDWHRRIAPSVEVTVGAMTLKGTALYAREFVGRFEPLCATLLSKED